MSKIINGAGVSKFLQNVMLFIELLCFHLFNLCGEGLGQSASIDKLLFPISPLMNLNFLKKQQRKHFFFDMEDAVINNTNPPFYALIIV